MTSGRKLGRGLSSLLSTRHAGEEPGEGGSLWVAVGQLEPNRQQPRLAVDKGLERLAESIRRHGMLQPIVVMPVGPDRYEILAGERRWRAAGLAGLKSVPVSIREGVTTDLERLELALIENIQREDLDPIERARACQQLQERYQLTQEQISERLGYERSTVANLVRLLDLPEGIQAAVSRETITAGHARALLRLNGHPAQAHLLEEIVKQDWSVRQTEEACANAAAEVRPQLRTARPRHPAWVRDLQERLTRSLGMRAEIRLLRKGGGRLVFHFQDLEELDRFVRGSGLPDEARELLGPS